MPFRPELIVGLLSNEFGCDKNASLMGRKEQKMFEKIKRIMHDAKTDDLLIVSEDEEEMEIVGCELDDENWRADDDGPVCYAIPDKVNFSGGSQVDLETAEKAVEFMMDVKTNVFRPMSSVQHRFRFIKTKRDMQKLRVFAKNQKVACSRASKFAKLSELLRTKVFEAMDGKIHVDKFSLRRLAIQINAESVHIDDFEASDRWLAKWKQSNGLVSRHITTFITKASFGNKEKTEEDAKKYVEDIRSELVTLDPDTVYNCDQSGFTKEQYCKRTLAPKGVKKVERLVQSKDALSHSYTILPMLSVTGKLAPKLYVVLQEKGGKFPKKGHCSPPNLIVRANSSHIMNKDLMRDWVQSAVCDSTVQKEVVLLLDSWPAWKNGRDVQEAALPGHTIHVRTIPPGSTSFIQPCDLYLFCPMKNFIKKVHSYIIWSGIEFKAFERDNLLRLISGVYFIFCAPRFQLCWQYGWYKGGYIDSHPPTFETPSNYCLEATGQCSQKKSRMEKCRNAAFLKCPYCEKNLCFHHWVGSGFVTHRC